MQMLIERAHQDLVDERRFAASADAGYRGEDAERKAHVDPAQIVRLGIANVEPAARFAPAARNRNELPAGEIGAGLGVGIGDHVGERARGEDLAAFGAGTRPDVDDDVGRAHRVLVVLDDDQRVAEIAQRPQRRQQTGRCRADASRSTARRGCRRRRPARCRSASRDRMRCDSPPASVVAERASVK